MNLKRFKTFLKEEATQDGFNEFVENTLEKNNIEVKLANDFLTPEFDFTGIVYKVVFFPKEEVMKYYTNEGTDHKGLTDILVKTFNQNRYVFFCKSLKSVENQISYPNLFKITETQVGIVYSNKVANIVDLTKYTGKNPKVKERLNKTQEVIGFEDLTINKIDALYIFEKNGWVMKQI